MTECAWPTNCENAALATHRPAAYAAFSSHRPASEKTSARTATRTAASRTERPFVPGAESTLLRLKLSHTHTSQLIVPSRLSTYLLSNPQSSVHPFPHLSPGHQDDHWAAASRHAHVHHVSGPSAAAGRPRWQMATTTLSSRRTIHQRLGARTATMSLRPSWPSGSRLFRCVALHHTHHRRRLQVRHYPQSVQASTLWAASLTHHPRTALCSGQHNTPRWSSAGSPPSRSGAPRPSPCRGAGPPRASGTTRATRVVHLRLRASEHSCETFRAVGRAQAHPPPRL